METKPADNKSGKRRVGRPTKHEARYRFVGRPSVVTPEVLNKLEQAFAIDATNGEACAYANISETVFYNYLKKNPEFAQRIEVLRQTPILAARQRVVKGITESYTNAMDFLKRKRRKEFGDASEVTLVPKPLLDNVRNNNSDKESIEAPEEN